MVDTMTQTYITLGGSGRAIVFPSAILVFNFDNDDDARLSQILSAHPGMPVVFLGTKFNREVFSQAEGRNRTFVFATKFVNRDEVDPVYPAMWLSDGDILPDLPGNVSVTGTDRGFRVDTLAPDAERTAMFV